MTWKNFIIQLSTVSLLLAVALIFIGKSQKLGDYVDLGWITWVLLVLVNILLFVFGTKASNSENKHTFLQLVLASMGGKMLLAFFLCIVYYQLTLPLDRLFILPLFIIYFGFTIFETYMMVKLGQQKGGET